MAFKPLLGAQSAGNLSRNLALLPHGHSRALTSRVQFWHIGRGELELVCRAKDDTDLLEAPDEDTTPKKKGRPRRDSVASDEATEGGRKTRSKVSKTAVEDVQPAVRGKTRRSTKTASKGADATVAPPAEDAEVAAEPKRRASRKSKAKTVEPVEEVGGALGGISPGSEVAVETPSKTNQGATTNAPETGIAMTVALEAQEVGEEILEDGPVLDPDTLVERIHDSSLSLHPIPENARSLVAQLRAFVLEMRSKVLHFVLTKMISNGKIMGLYNYEMDRAEPLEQSLLELQYAAILQEVLEHEASAMADPALAAIKEVLKSMKSAVIPITEDNENEVAACLDPRIIHEPATVAHNGLLLSCIANQPHVKQRDIAVMRVLAEGIVSQQRGDGSFAIRILPPGWRDTTFSTAAAAGMSGLLEAYSWTGDKSYLYDTLHALSCYEKKVAKAKILDNIDALTLIATQTRVVREVMELLRNEPDQLDPELLGDLSPEVLEAYTYDLQEELLQTAAALSEVMQPAEEDEEAEEAGEAGEDEDLVDQSLVDTVLSPALLWVTYSLSNALLVARYMGNEEAILSCLDKVGEYTEALACLQVEEEDELPQSVRGAFFVGQQPYGKLDVEASIVCLGILDTLARALEMDGLEGVKDGLVAEVQGEIVEDREEEGARTA